MTLFHFVKKGDTSFIVKNVSSSRRTLKLFNHKLPYQTTLDLLAIPGITEEHIRTSLLKGDLRFKLSNSEISIVSSDINLLQFNSEERQFLENHGVSNGVIVKETSGLKVADPNTKVEIFGRIKSNLSFQASGSYALTVDASELSEFPGGPLTLKSGDGAPASADGYDGAAGGRLTFTAGDGGAGLTDHKGGDGGAIEVKGGDGGNDNGMDGGAGGHITIQGGRGKGDQNGGNVTLNAGAAIGAGDDGNVRLGISNTTQIDVGVPLRPIAGGSIQSSFTADAGESISAGAPVGIEDPTGDGYGPLAYLADADAAGTRNLVCGLAASEVVGDGYADVVIVMSGELAVADSIWDSVPAATDCGKNVWLSTNAGKLTITKPTASGAYAHRVGFVTRGGSGSVKVAVNIIHALTANV